MPLLKRRLLVQMTDSARAEGVSELIVAVRRSLRSAIESIQTMFAEDPQRHRSVRCERAQPSGSLAHE